MNKNQRILTWLALAAFGLTLLIAPWNITDYADSSFSVTRKEYAPILAPPKPNTMVGSARLDASVLFVEWFAIGVVYRGTLSFNQREPKIGSGMKVKTCQDTVRKLVALLECFDAGTEQFLDDLPTPQKYAVLAMALTVRGDYKDFELAYEESMHKVLGKDLTKHLLDFPSLDYHLQDALRLKWSYFEVVWIGDDEGDA